MMTDDDLKKVLFVLIMLRNKMKDDPETIKYIDEAIGYIESHFGLR